MAEVLVNLSQQLAQLTLLKKIVEKHQQIRIVFGQD